MEKIKSKKKKWYQRKEVHALAGLALTALAYIPEIAQYTIGKVFPAHTLVYEWRVGIGLGLSAIWSAIGLRKGYKANNLPSGVTKVMDKIPNRVTGKKGEDL